MHSKKKSSKHTNQFSEQDINDINRINYIQNFIPSYTASQITVPYEYFDVGKNTVLREEVTEYYQKNVLEWINKDWKSFSKHKKFIKSKKGFKYIYDVLRQFVKNSDVNWFELREGPNAVVIKDYIKYKLGFL
jgi:hypothetical protein